MKRTSIFFLLVLLVPFSKVFAAGNKLSNEPDSVYLFSYATTKNNNHNGLHFAWSRDKESWFVIGNEYGYLRSDYGRWGSEKRMLTPFLLPGANGTWQCVWSLNEKDKAFAHASSSDLVDWGRQSYPEVKTGTNVVQPVITYDDRASVYNITYTDASGKYFRVNTKDFKIYSAAKEIPSTEYKNLNTNINLPGGTATGQVYKVSWSTVDKLIKTFENRQYKSSLYGEFAKDDAQRFAGLKSVDATITLQAEKAKPISDMLLGIFFEDINYAADGGIYAELIQNRDFEYNARDKDGRDKTWTATHSWTLKGENTIFTIDSAAPIHENNPHYAVLETKTPGAALVNSGFDGIALKKGEKYSLSLFTKQLEGKGGKMLVRLVDKSGKALAETTINTTAGQWKNIKAVLTASVDVADACLELQPLSAGRLAVDMISLFPQKTFKGRSNGMRADLAQVVADIHPRFVRFPGGCVAHGDGLGNIYKWKNTIGPLEARKPQRNLWNYHQTAGLGYYEYFQFCEDIGAAPLPVIAAGVPCQNSGHGDMCLGGQQGGIPLSEMDAYIQDILDLIEWANGGANTKWGKVRAASGHPKPFNLKYIGIGNEDLITDIFEERFTLIFNAIKEKHPEITVIGTVGPFYEGTDYEEGWELASKLKVPMVDEHYYVSPSWMIYNQDYYDRYDRSKSKVYLGEYAAHVPGRANNLETALAEALYLTSVERNGDVVSMASYAPLLAKEGHTQWNPDMIYFNNTEVKPTVGYEVQKLYGHHSGNEYLPASINVSNNQDAVKNRIAYSVVRDSKSKDLIVKMVNMLPVAVHSAIDLGNVALASTKGMKTVMHGKPDDKNVKPVEGECAVAGKFTTELPAYSFTVIRIKTQ